VIRAGSGKLGRFMLPVVGFGSHSERAGSGFAAGSAFVRRGMSGPGGAVVESLVGWTCAEVLFESAGKGQGGPAIAGGEVRPTPGAPGRGPRRAWFRRS